MKHTLPQRVPGEATTWDWSACITQLDSLLAALRAWQPGAVPPSPPTAQDMAVLAAFRSPLPEADD